VDCRAGLGEGAVSGGDLIRYLSTESLDCPVSRCAVGNVESVPVCRQHQRRIAEGAHQARRILEDFPSFRHRANQGGIRPQTLHLAFDVVHGPEDEQLHAVKTNEIGERNSDFVLGNFPERLQSDLVCREKPPLFAYGVRAVRSRAIVRIGEDPVKVETLQEKDCGACSQFETLRHPDGVTDTGLLQNDVRTTLHAGDK
jgi:hypothetical protein